MKTDRRIILISAAVLFLLAVIISFQNPGATGYIVKNDSLNYYLDNPETAMNEYNSNIDNVPSFVKAIFGDERINAEIELAEGSRRYGIVTEKGIIMNVTEGYIEEHTLEVYTTEETVNKIIEAEDQVEALREALDNKEIEYKAVKVKTKIKTFFAKIALGIASWFG
ncbi:hypothetical protein KY345_06090 [Candidatus Woesearchaeota archaeon]|nr:hypothetical protein [Candidatus Woesearchaeota archaeon]